MAYFIIALFVIVWLHFIYESILLPIICLNLRYKLFALRDSLRELLYQDPDELTDERFRQMESSINRALGSLGQFNLLTIRRVRREFKDNPEFAEDLQKRIKFLESCDIEEYQRIRQSLYKIFGIAILVNSMCAFLMAFVLLSPVVLIIIPVVLIMSIGGKIKGCWTKLKTYWAELKITLKKILCLPKNDYHRFNNFAPT